MNRRGFLGLLGKLVAVGTAMGVAPGLLKPVKSWLVVDPSGGGDYTDIQAALDALPADGGTIFLREGSYPGSLLDLSKAVFLKGESAKKDGK